MGKNLSDVGLIGLAVMGQNLALNIADHGFRISVYNRTAAKTNDFVARHPNTPGALVGMTHLSDFIKSLARPRKVLMLVKAGAATDAVIREVTPLLEPGDIVVDSGNAKWTDTIRREKELAAQKLRFVGMGISGGEEGARFGPSIMPGGHPDACKELDPILRAVAAKVDPLTGKPLKGAAPGNPVKGGIPCTAYIGPDGAGHYVKMVHNGIEYGDMQLICEAYDLMHTLLGMSPEAIGDIFNEWNKGVLDSFLVEITSEILKQKDPVTGQPFIHSVLDAAGQKGTGKWTSISALDLGVPAPTVAEAVFARCLSALKAERTAAARVLCGPKGGRFNGDRDALVHAIHDALYCAKICSYAQGFHLMRTAQEDYNWRLNFGQIAQIFRGGCIIRARFLQKITEAYDRDAQLPSLLLDPYFKEAVHTGQHHWRRVVAAAIQYGVPVPTLSSALAYFDGYRTERLPQNLLQAQRDFFGAHTYERTDQPRGHFFHIDWSHPERPQKVL